MGFQFTAIAVCLCGYFGDLEHSCTCSHYQKCPSGPLLNRDIYPDVPHVPFQNFSDERCGERRWW